MVEKQSEECHSEERDDVERETEGVMGEMGRSKRIQVTEKEFTTQVAAWCSAELRRLNAGSLRDARPERLVIKCDGSNIKCGQLAWTDDDNSDIWHWESTPRQLDVVIGLDVLVDGAPETIPLIAIELKTGKGLNTDELDKKSAVYGALRELYPWCKNVLILRDSGARGWPYLMRNARRFDVFLTEWTPKSQSVFRKLLDAHLEYTLRYWRF